MPRAGIKSAAGQMREAAISDRVTMTASKKGRLKVSGY